MVKFDNVTRSSSQVGVKKNPRFSLVPHASALSSVEPGPIDRQTLAALMPQKVYEHTPEEQKRFLGKYGFTDAMTKKAMDGLLELRHTYSLINNSGVMDTDDGRRIIGFCKDSSVYARDELITKMATKEKEMELVYATCDRLTEMMDSVDFQIEVAASFQSPTTLQFINPPVKGTDRTLIVGVKDDREEFANSLLSLEENAEHARDTIDKVRLTGVARSIVSLIKEVHKVAEDQVTDTENGGGRILVTIFSSSFPWGAVIKGDKKEEEFIDLLNSFENLPVKFIFIKLPSDQAVSDYYDGLRSKCEKADVTVSADFGQMVTGISKFNNWLNYCRSLHMSEVLGLCENLLVDASRRPLSLKEIGELCGILFGDVPDPEQVGMRDFVNKVDILLEDEQMQWNPSLGNDAHLVDTKKLLKAQKKMNKKSSMSGAATIDHGPAKESADSCCTIL